MNSQFSFIGGFLLTLICSWFSAAYFDYEMPFTSGIKNICVFFIFFISGRSLPLEKILTTLRNLKIHVFIQLVSLLFIPLGYLSLLDPVLHEIHLPQSICTGFLFLGFLPTTITGCVILTRISNGCEATSLCNAVIGNLLGVIITPLWLVSQLNETVSISAGDLIIKLSLIVLLPFTLGQLSKFMKEGNLPGNQLLKTVSQLLLLVILFFIFSETFSNDLHLSLINLIKIITITLILYTLTFFLIRVISQLSCFRFSKAETIAISITASHKTLALGIPILTIVFHANPEIALISLPLICYHSIQMLIGSLFRPA